jgi:hypothetical protein
VGGWAEVIAAAATNRERARGRAGRIGVRL